MDKMVLECAPDYLCAGVIGHPIAHSKSPVIHGYWLEKFGIKGCYARYDILPEYLEQGISDLVSAGIRGFNVTIPYKIEIMKYCEELSDEARAIGAVNTVVVREDGTLFGTNTDYFGFIENIREAKPTFDFTNGSAVVLGAGGASRAVIYGLKKAGVPQIVIVNRTPSKAEALALEFGCSHSAWEDLPQVLGSCHLLVNTTSLGMTGQDPLNIDISGLSESCLVSDIVYAPLMTDLLLSAEARGLDFVSGIGMLLHQARPGFKAWFGQDVTVDKPLLSCVLG
ncbi:MAG: shikimate dehydrogenase [Pseudobdellovibrionaceae bacterium]|jgi:shikimate dehydrogenase|nr:shikimate dehydrogenase [Pseudobdellovibrionaceae bacterium]